MDDTRTFKKGELVIVWNGSTQRSSIELAQVGKDCSYIDKEVLINYGAFNTAWSKKSVHKLPPALKKLIREEKK